MQEWAGRAPASPAGAPDALFPVMEESELRLLTWERLRHPPPRGPAGSLGGTARAHAHAAASRRPPPLLYELRNMHTVAGLIARCALARQESRGAHFRADFPEKQSEFQKHSLVTQTDEVTFF